MPWEERERLARRMVREISSYPFTVLTHSTVTLRTTAWAPPLLNEYMKAPQLGRGVVIADGWYEPVLGPVLTPQPSCPDGHRGTL